MSEVRKIAIRAIAGAVPTKVSRTADYEFLSVEERARFEKIVGIKERRIVNNQKQCGSDLCMAAATRVLEHLQWDRSSVGALVLITQTPDQPIPATSIVLQHKLGLSQNCIAFDVNLGCSAFPYGLAIVTSLMQSLGINRALLLVGDVSSKTCAINDRSAWPLFGDAGTATALEISPDAPPIYFELMSDGSGKDAIIVPAGGPASRQHLGYEAKVKVAGDDGIERYADNIVLRGSDIFSFAISRVPTNIKRTMIESGDTPATIDYAVLHQANKMINDTIIKKTGFKPEQAPGSLAKFGNSGSASVALTISANADKFESDKRVLVCGFGVGLSWGCAIFVIPRGAVLPIVESDDDY
ncbi:3-oxoacyl-ACP synthase III family protein [Rhodanobacter sp. BL-MT-08]